MRAGTGDTGQVPVTPQPDEIRLAYDAMLAVERIRALVKDYYRQYEASGTWLYRERERMQRIDDATTRLERFFGRQVT